ncbi:hypothetical protein BHE74_00037540 [Ensete ventricosum]|nr:hypothetical protein BHE74_00037540 [Ensete ventricosum]
MVDHSQPILAQSPSTNFDGTGSRSGKRAGPTITLKSSTASLNVNRVSRGTGNQESSRDTNAVDGHATWNPRGGFVN